MRRLNGHFLNGEEGFSMAEVVCATIIFIASVVGISSMLVSGGANINRSATENAAANLAARRLEEVKSLPYYMPWDSSKGNQDIDDTYYNTGLTNANQLNNPYVVENYGTISGFSKYKRTTAIQYQYLSGGQLQPCVMNSTWVPKNPSGAQTDKQIGGANAASTDSIHAMIIEVRVHYMMNGVERVYKERAIAGDLMVTGGSNNPVLVVTSINPQTGTTSQNHMLMRIFVTSTRPITSGTFRVSLWYAGRNDIVGTGTTVASGTEINTYFDFTPTSVQAGTYNLSVYWQDAGFTDKSFRECFILDQPPPVIESIDSHTWGCRAHVSRQVNIHGQNLNNPAMVRLVGQNYGSYDWTGYTASSSVVTSSTTLIVANFNLTSIPSSIGGRTTNNTRWNIEVTNSGGEKDTSSGDAERLLVNPPPQNISINSWPASSYTGTKVGNTLSGIGVTGSYIQNYPSLPTVYIIQSSAAPVTGTVYKQLSGGSVPDDGTYDSGMSANVTVNPMGFGRWGTTAPTDAQLAPLGSSPDNYGTYYIYLVNADGQAAVSSNSRNITHKRYTISGVATPSGWGSVSGSGTFWQDQNWTLTPSGNSVSGRYDVVFRGWGSPGDHSWGAFSNQTGTATADATYYARMGKLFWDGNSGSPNRATFIRGKNNSPNEYSMNYSDSGNCMRLHAWGDAGLLSSNDGEISGVTTNTVDFAGATTLWINWRQTNGTICDEFWTLNISGGQGDGYGTGQRLKNQGEGGWTWESTGVSGTATQYIHVNAYGQGSAPWLNGNSDTRVRFLFMQ